MAQLSDLAAIIADVTVLQEAVVSASIILSASLSVVTAFQRSGKQTLPVNSAFDSSRLITFPAQCKCASACLAT